MLPNRFDTSVAPSGAFVVTGVIVWAMTESSGRAKPSIPEYCGPNVSFVTLVTAANYGNHLIYLVMTEYAAALTESLVIDFIPA